MKKRSLLVATLAYLTPLLWCHAQDLKSSTTTAAPAVTTTQLTPEIGGIKQFVEIKTDDTNKPVLLFLSGGPGSP